MSFKHGTAHGYRTYACRCVPCTEAHRERHAREQEARYARPDADVPHGTSSASTNWGCHCDTCRAADRMKQARTRARRKILDGKRDLLSPLERQAIEEAGQ